MRALGWLYKANILTNQPAHDAVARWLARTLIDHDAALYSQHIRGIHNIIVDILSRDFHIPDTHLVHMLNLLLPKQTPMNLKISILPPEIIFWLHSLPPSSTKIQASPQHPSRSKLGALTDVNDSWETMESKMSGLMSIISNNENHLLSAFAISCQRNQYGKTIKTILIGGTVMSTVTNVCLNFQTNLWPDPTLYLDQRQSLFLT